MYYRCYRSGLEKKLAGKIALNGLHDKKLTRNAIR